jgi:exosortase
VLQRVVVPAAHSQRITAALPVIATLTSFALLFAAPAGSLVQDWWHDPEAGHGLLLAPVAVWLAWRSGLEPKRHPATGLGVTLLVAAVLLRYAGAVAAELYSSRGSIVMALAGCTLIYSGMAQLKRWWLPFLLLCLAIPLPSLVINSIALPLQLLASAAGTWLLDLRGVPVRVTGNVIHLPGHQLFVTEACSGLRSLVALLSLGVLLAGLWLRTPLGRVLLVAAAIPVAIAVNAVRVFLTGFLVYYVSPTMGEGFLHATEGWLLFLVALGALAGVTAMIAAAERGRASGPAIG